MHQITHWKHTRASCRWLWGPRGYSDTSSYGRSAVCTGAPHVLLICITSVDSCITSVLTVWIRVSQVYYQCGFVYHKCENSWAASRLFLCCVLVNYLTRVFFIYIYIYIYIYIHIDIHLQIDMCRAPCVQICHNDVAVTPHFVNRDSHKSSRHFDDSACQSLSVSFVTVFLSVFLVCLSRDCLSRLSLLCLSLFTVSLVCLSCDCLSRLSLLCLSLPCLSLSWLSVSSVSLHCLSCLSLIHVSSTYW